MTPINLDELEQLARLSPPAGPEPFWAEQVLALIERLRAAEARLAKVDAWAAEARAAGWTVNL